MGCIVYASAYVASNPFAVSLCEHRPQRGVDQLRVGDPDVPPTDLGE
jgi:hypothetical protein